VNIVICTCFHYPWFYFSVMRSINILSAATAEAAVQAPECVRSFTDSPHHFDSRDYKLRSLILPLAHVCTVSWVLVLKWIPVCHMCPLRLIWFHRMNYITPSKIIPKKSFGLRIGNKIHKNRISWIATYNISILMKTETATQIYVKDSHIKFDKNPFSGSRDVTCRQTDRQWQS
jgi:hypothetical protein